MKVRTILPVVLLLGVIATPSLAKEEFDRGSADDQQACTPDVFRLCSSFIPNVSSIVNCLKTERRNLSPECRVVMDRRANSGNVRKVVKETR